MNYTTPILIVSGNLEPEILKKIRGKIQHILVKPFGNEAFIEKVKQLIA